MRVLPLRPSDAPPSIISALVLCTTLVALTGCAPALLHVAMGTERGRGGLSETQQHIGGLKLTVLRRDIGSAAPTAVLVHGFGGDKDNWTRMAAHLPASWNLLIPDLAGFGESERREGADHDVLAQVERLHALIQTAPSRPVVLVGNSMGGHIAAALSVRHPGDVSSLILVDAAGVVSPVLSEVRLAMQRGENPLLTNSVEDFDRVMGLMFVQPPAIPGVVKTYFAERAALNRNFNDHIFKQMAAKPHPLEPVLERVQAPTLILWGKEDRVLHHSGAQVFQAGIRGARVVIMEGTGHTPMIERPKEVADVIAAFVGVSG